MKSSSWNEIQSNLKKYFRIRIWKGQIHYCLTKNGVGNKQSPHSYERKSFLHFNLIVSFVTNRECIVIKQIITNPKKKRKPKNSDWDRNKRLQFDNKKMSGWVCVLKKRGFELSIWVNDSIVTYLENTIELWCYKYEVNILSICQTERDQSCLPYC